MLCNGVFDCKMVKAHGYKTPSTIFRMYSKYNFKWKLTIRKQQIECQSKTYFHYYKVHQRYNIYY